MQPGLWILALHSSQVRSCVRACVCVCLSVLSVWLSGWHSMFRMQLRNAQKQFLLRKDQNDSMWATQNSFGQDFSENSWTVSVDQPRTKGHILLRSFRHFSSNLAALPDTRPSSQREIEWTSLGPSDVPFRISTLAPRRVNITEFCHQLCHISKYMSSSFEFIAEQNNSAVKMFTAS